MYNEGLSTLFEVLDFQEDLATAQEANIQAIVDYNKAFINLEYARGTLLQSYGVLFEPSRFQPGNPPVGFPVGFH